jgi:hypothetical protein
MFLFIRFIVSPDSWPDSIVAHEYITLVELICKSQAMFHFARSLLKALPVTARAKMATAG